MGTSIRGCLGAWLVGVMVAAAAGAEGTDEAQRALDRRLYAALREMHNKGADLYNGGDAAGCYRLFQGGLLTAKGVLPHRPDVQKLIEERLADVEKEPAMPKRAFALHQLIEDIRSIIRPADLKSEGGAGRSADTRPAPAEPPPVDDRSSSLPRRTLWDRLGGERGVRSVVDDFVALASRDPKVDFTRGGKYRLTEETTAHLKKALVDFISEAAGGPFRYSGQGMKEEHRGMGITTAEFDAAVADLRQALQDNQVAPQDIEAVVRAVEATRKSIVEPANLRSPAPAGSPDKKSPPARPADGPRRP